MSSAEPCNRVTEAEIRTRQRVGPQDHPCSAEEQIFALRPLPHGRHLSKQDDIGTSGPLLSTGKDPIVRRVPGFDLAAVCEQRCGGPAAGTRSRYAKQEITFNILRMRR